MARSKIEAYDILSNLRENTLRSAWNNVFVSLKTQYEEEDLEKLALLFEANLADISRFPNVSGTFGHPPASKQNAEAYFERWAQRYLDTELPSQHEGSRPKSPYDTMIYQIISFLEEAGASDVDEIRRNHEMAMQSENMIGELLEEFIDSQISKYGWIWCKGSAMRAVDFYYPGDELSGSSEAFLQVKNKYNTENSSSSNIRSGTDIQKWNRLINKRIPGTDAAVANWDALYAIVFTNVGIVPDDDIDLSEEGFAKFIAKACAQNPKLIVS